jgi:MinD-like ATPase involved in chromosome partitioning or flagellar assembly
LSARFSNLSVEDPLEPRTPEESTMTQQAPLLPSFSAFVRDDSTADLTIDGVRQLVSAPDEAAVREEIIARVTRAAIKSGGPVRLVAEDSQGQSPLIVHPDGRVESDGDFVPAAQRRPTVGDTAREPAREPEPTPEPERMPEPKRASAPTPAPRPVAKPEPKLVARPEPKLVPEPVPVSMDSLLAGAPAVKAATPDRHLPPASLPDPSLSDNRPDLADFLNTRPKETAGPPERGWQGSISRMTGGRISPSPNRIEATHRAAIAEVQRGLSGPRTIVVLNPKGGAHKTTATLLIAATFGIHRGGYTLAWDNNETMGTLGIRAKAAGHRNTAVDLLRDLDRLDGDRTVSVADIDRYVRNQGDSRFDALASDLDPAGAASIDDVAFRKLHSTLSRFYRVVVIDTGNNMRASNWEAAVETADQLVVVSTIREDTAYGAASLLDGLRQKGHADKVAQAVTILASPAKRVDGKLSRRLHDHFKQLTRTVLDVPYDPSLVAGGPLNIEALDPRTREAWLRATAAIAEGL